MNCLRCCCAVLACLILAACGGATSSSQPAAPGPAATASAEVIRTGDRIAIRLSGVPPDDAYLIEVQIPDNGTFTVPLMARSFQAIGHTTSGLAGEIAAAYRDGKIYSTPNVTIISEERYISVGGDVRNPQRVSYTPDLTLLGAINACGGFTEFANKHAVRILRGQQVIEVDAVKAAKQPGDDPPLYAGDQIYVPRTFL